MYIYRCVCYISAFLLAYAPTITDCQSVIFGKLTWGHQRPAEDAVLRALLGLQKEKAQLKKATGPSARGNSYFLMEAFFVL